jgi:GTP-binding protein
VVADVPGLIEGAHLGHGLGIKFLRHVQRTRLLVHLVDVSPYTQRDPIQDYITVMEELEAFDNRLIKRPQILVANKIDLLEEDNQRMDMVKSLARKKNLPFFAISALKKEGIRELILAMAKGLDSQSFQAEKS